MKRTVLVLLLALPASIASAYPVDPFQEYRELAAQMGCPGVTFAIDREAQAPNAMFMFDQKAIVLSQGLVDRMSPRVLRAVVAHEIGHCLQWQEGLTRAILAATSHAAELDADRRSAEHFCRTGEGVDGILEGFEQMVRAYGPLAARGDARHPAVYLRMATAKLACALTTSAN